MSSSTLWSDGVTYVESRDYPYPPLLRLWPGLSGSLETSLKNSSRGTNPAPLNHHPLLRSQQSSRLLGIFTVSSLYIIHIEQRGIPNQLHEPAFSCPLGYSGELTLPRQRLKSPEPGRTPPIHASGGNLLLRSDGQADLSPPFFLNCEPSLLHDSYVLGAALHPSMGHETHVRAWAGRAGGRGRGRGDPFVSPHRLGFSTLFLQQPMVGDTATKPVEQIGSGSTCNS